MSIHRACRALLRGGVVHITPFIGLLLLVGCGTGNEAPGAIPEGIELPRVGTLGRAPAGPGTIVVNIDADGRISLDGKGPLSLIALRRELKQRTADPRWRERDFSSLKILLVNADASLPWPVAQWVMMVAAEPHCQLYRVFLGARARGSGAAGALGWALPKDGSLRGIGGGPDHVPLRVKLVNQDGPASAPEDVLGALRKAAGDRSLRDVKLELAILRGKGGAVPTGFVVQVMALALDAGVRWIFLEGAPASWPDDLSDVDAMLARVAALKAEMRVPTLLVGKKTLGALPAHESVPVARGRLAHLLGSRVEKTEPKPTSDDEPSAGDPSLTPEPERMESAGEPRFGFLGPAGALPGRVDPFRTRKRAEKSETNAVERGLAWLAAHQSPNGGWEADGFGRWCAGKQAVEGDRPDGRGSAHHDPGVTGLALCAFLAAGHTNRGRHAYAKVVSKGLRYLRNVQDAEGCFGPRTHTRFIYDHAAAALAMVEAYGMTGSPIFRSSARKSLEFIGQCRNSGAVWRYGVKPGDNDTSVTAWMAMPLIAAQWINEDAEDRDRKAPLPIETDAFAAILAWLERMTDHETGRVGYETRGFGPDRPAVLRGVFPPEQSESTTAAGVLLRMLIADVTTPTDALQTGIARLVAAPPRFDPEAGTIDHVYWYFGALAAHQVGGEFERTWEAALDDVVRGSQRTDTEPCRYLGSWDPVGPWGREGGRVAATALMTMTLLTPDRYPRPYGLR